jgi:hypothetical protein
MKASSWVGLEGESSPAGGSPICSLGGGAALIEPVGDLGRSSFFSSASCATGGGGGGRSLSDGESADWDATELERECVELAFLSFSLMRSATVPERFSPACFGGGDWVYWSGDLSEAVPGANCALHVRASHYASTTTQRAPKTTHSSSLSSARRILLVYC